MEKYLAIDIGGTSVKHGLVWNDGHIEQRGGFPTGEMQTEEGFVQELLNVVETAVCQGAAGIGVCSLGCVNTHTGRFVGGVENLPYLLQLDIPALLKARYPRIPVTIRNDVSAAAIGEMRFGAAKNCRSFVCLAIGTGIGGAVVVNGQVLEGAHFRAGEFGYWGYFGKDRYLEKEVSAKWMVRQAADMLGVEGLTGIDFFERIRGGDTACRSILEVQAERLAECIANLIIALDVEKVVVGGGISGASDVLIPVLREKTRQRLPVEFRGQCELVAAQCANDAGMLGAVDSFLR
jgi:predicted NBD/HSP70 family sugar kinase